MAMTTTLLTLVPPGGVTEKDIDDHYKARERGRSALLALGAEAHKLEAGFVTQFVAQSPLDVSALRAKHDEVERALEQLAQQRAALERFLALLKTRICDLKGTWPNAVAATLRDMIAKYRSEKDTAQGVADGVEEKIALLTQELDEVLSVDAETADEDPKSKKAKRSRRQAVEEA